MSASRSLRAISIIASSALVLGAFLAVPADAKKKKKAPAGCPAFAPIEPNSPSGQTAEVLEQPVVKVTDEHTAEKPLVIEYSHGAALWSITQEPIQEDTAFFNLQVETAQPEAGIYVFQEWAQRPGSDMDLYLWDGATGDESTHSGSSNVTPVPLPPSPAGPDHGQTTGGWGLESISGFAVTNCAGFTAESRAFTTPGEAMTLTVWLGEVVAAEE